jgi:hypothetical protein
MSPPRRNLLRVLVGGALGVALALALCGGGSFTAIHFLRQPPDDVRSVVEPRLGEIRALAEVSRGRCPSIRQGGVEALIQGGAGPSPARGTPLARDAAVLQVGITCYWYDGPPDESGSRSAAGNNFLPLYEGRSNPSARDGEGSWQIDRGFFPSGSDRETEERASWPSFEVEETRSIDVTVCRPFEDGSGWVEVTATLRRSP